MTVGSAAADPKLKVFISYSRRDSRPLVDELVAGLDLLGFDAVIDRQDIAAAEDWEARLGMLIHAADTVIFVLSPASVRSERCAWEVRKAHDLSKRLIPIVGSAVPNEEVPEELRRLNYVFFTEGSSFARSLGQVADALRADLDWIREHTRFAEAAVRWQARDRIEALLLRDDELAAAQAWMTVRKAGAPEITDGQRALIAASTEAQTSRRNAEQQRLNELATLNDARASALADRERAVRTLQRRTVLAGLGAGVFSLGIGGLGYWGWQAERRFRSERDKAQRAQEASVEAAIAREAGRTDIEGQLVAYAASPGEFALDMVNGESNSPYTKRVLEELAHPDASLQTALTRAGRNVLTLTEFKQRPYVASDLNGDLYFHRQPAKRAGKAVVVSMMYPSVMNLQTPRADGNRWEEFLRARGFDTVHLAEPGHQQVEQALQAAAFAPPERSGNVAQKPPANTCVVFVFSGAGMRSGSDLYLIFADTLTPNDKVSAVRALEVSELSRRLRRQAASSVLILDTMFAGR